MSSCMAQPSGMFHESTADYHNTENINKKSHESLGLKKKMLWPQTTSNTLKTELAIHGEGGVHISELNSPALQET